MKIVNAWTHQETGIGTYTIVGLGDDNKMYEWKGEKDLTETIDPNNKIQKVHKTTNNSGWILRKR